MVSTANSAAGAFRIPATTVGSGMQGTGLNFDDGTLIHYGEGGGSSRPGDADSTVDFTKTLAADGQMQQQKNGAPNAAQLAPPPAYQRQAGMDQLLANAVQGMRLEGAEGQNESASSTWDGSAMNQAVDAAFHKAMNGHGDYAFLRELPTEELLRRKEQLDKEMEAEFQELQARYHAKRKAILDAIALKKNGTVQF